jgi:DNA polymerase-3 subunit beta
MRFSCNRSRLADVAGLVGQAVAGKSTKKIFECLRLRADEGVLEVAGTDLEVAVRYRLSEEIDIGTTGEAVVPAQLLASLLREIADEQVSVSVAKQKLTLQTDGGVFELECEDPAQFPETPQFPAEATGRIAADDLRALARKTAFAAGKEAARFVLNGVQVTAEEDGLRCVATDGRRLAMLRRPLERVGAGVVRSSIMGVKGLQHFERVSAGVEGSVEIALADRFVAIRTDKAEVTVRVMDGNFPKYEEVIPKGCDKEAGVPVGVLRARLRQVGQFTSVESQSVVLTIKSGEMALAASGGDGRADARLAIEYDGPEEKVGFNPAYLLDALKVVDGEQVTFAFANRNSAAKLTDDAGFLYVIMPVLID